MVLSRPPLLIGGHNATARPPFHHRGELLGQRRGWGQATLGRHSVWTGPGQGRNGAPRSGPQRPSRMWWRPNKEAERRGKTRAQLRRADGAAGTDT
jgi:hypothetical protein